MADNDAASWAFDVPGLGISPAQALMFNRQQEEKEQARQDAIAQRNQYRQDQERERNEFRQSNILNRIDATKYHTGLQKFDDWAASKVDDIMAKYSDPKYASMPMNEFTATLNRDVLPLKSGYGAVKSKLEQEMANIKNVVAQNKYLDEAKLRDDVLNDIAGDYMTQDDKFGGHTFKPVDQMDLNKSHTLDRLTGPNAYNYVNNAGIAEFEKGILDTIPKNGGNLYSLKRPDGGITNYQGRMSPYQVMPEQPNQYGFMSSAPRYSVAKEQGRVDANGNPVEALPEDLMKRMIDTPAKAMVFRKMMDMNPQMGLNPNNQLDQQRFAYGMLNTLLGSNQPGIHSQVQPPGRNHTTINNNAAKEPAVRDFYHEIANKLSQKKEGFDMPFNEISPSAQEILLKQANALYPNKTDEAGNPVEKFDQSNVQIGKRGDGIFLVDNRNNRQILPISYEDINTKANTGVKAKQQVIKNAAKNTTPIHQNKPATSGISWH